MSSSLKISMIAAIAENNVIGIENKLPWYIPEDLQHFKSKTLNKSILMGRKTYESLGKPLPSRHNIVLTRNKDFNAPCDIVYDIEQAKKLALAKGYTELVIIGGAKIYQATMDLADTLYITYVHKNFLGDAYFPEFDSQLWQQTYKERFTSKNAMDYSIVTYESLSTNNK